MRNYQSFKMTGHSPNTAGRARRSYHIRNSFGIYCSSAQTELFVSPAAQSRWGSVYIADPVVECQNARAAEMQGNSSLPPENLLLASRQVLKERGKILFSSYCPIVPQ